MELGLEAAGDSVSKSSWQPGSYRVSEGGRQASFLLSRTFKTMLRDMDAKKAVSILVVFRNHDRRDAAFLQFMRSNDAHELGACFSTASNDTFHIPRPDSPHQTSAVTCASLFELASHWMRGQRFDVVVGNGVEVPEVFVQRFLGSPLSRKVCVTFGDGDPLLSASDAQKLMEGRRKRSPFNVGDRVRFAAPILALSEVILTVEEVVEQDGVDMIRAAALLPDGISIEAFKRADFFLADFLAEEA